MNLFRNTFSLSEYRCLLERFLGYYLPWEHDVRAFDLLLLNGRSKSANLFSDLEDLGLQPSECANVALCDALPVLDTRPRILGSMYVIEGATLGGQILQRHFAAHFDFKDRGCAFFSGYGDQTGFMWRKFADILNALPSEDADTAVGSALSTFESLRAWLCAPAPPQTSSSLRELLV